MIEKGIPGEVLVQMIRYNPAVLQLKDTLARLLFWRDFVGNNDKALLKIISRNSFLFFLHIDKHNLPRLNLLKEYGLSNGDMVSLLEGRSCWGRNLVSLRQILDLIEELGIPRGSKMFLYGLKAIGNYSRSKIKSNEEFFKNTYGWSQEERRVAFQKFPVILKLSEENVKPSMNFLMSKAGIEANNIALRPQILRYNVLSTLQSNGLKKSCRLVGACPASESRFHEVKVDVKENCSCKNVKNCEFEKKAAMIISHKVKEKVKSQILSL